MNPKYTDEELDALIEFGKPNLRDGIATYNALIELKMARQEIKKLTDYKYLYEHLVKHNNKRFVQLKIAVSCLNERKRVHDINCQSVDIFNNLQTTGKRCNCSVKKASEAIEKIGELDEQ